MLTSAKKGDKIPRGGGGVLQAGVNIFGQRLDHGEKMTKSPVGVGVFYNLHFPTTL